MSEEPKLPTTHDSLIAPSPTFDGADGSNIDVSVVVVNFNTAGLLKEMRDALMQSKGDLSLQTIVIDNASLDDSVAVLQREFSDAHVIVNQANVGFGRANNQALGIASGRYVLLLNTDAFVAPDTLASTVRYMDEHPECGVLGVRLVGRNGELQPACRNFPTPWNMFLSRAGLARIFPKVRMVDEPLPDDETPRECDWVVGCYMLVRTSVIEQCGLFDPRYFLYFEEVDFCRRAKRAGWKVVHFPCTTVVHLGGESAKSIGPVTAAGQQISKLQIESSLLYYRKNHGPVGVFAFILLSWLSDLIHVTKWLFRGGGLKGLEPVFDHARATLSLLVKTRVGCEPTR